MWPLYAFIRTSAPYIVFPFAIIIGSIGYFYETRIRKIENKDHYFESTISERRDKRLLNEIKSKDPSEIKNLSYSDYPKTIFEKNVSPSPNQRHFTAAE